MIKQAASSRRARARRFAHGEAMFEALVAMVVSLSVLLGVGYSTSRVLNLKRDQSTHTLALSQLRAQLGTNGDLGALCAASGMTINVATSSVPLTSNCTWGVATVSLASDPNVTHTTAAPVLQAMTLSTVADNANAVGALGGNGVVQVSQ